MDLDQALAYAKQPDALSANGKVQVIRILAAEIERLRKELADERQDNDSFRAWVAGGAAE